CFNWLSFSLKSAKYSAIFCILHAIKKYSNQLCKYIGKIEEKKISKSKNLKKFSFKKIIANSLLLFLNENSLRFFDFEIFFSSLKNYIAEFLQTTIFGLSKVA
ncbi:hypothetical protein BpHYR1_015230, partial [Brachionus plicatilis]